MNDFLTHSAYISVFISLIAFYLGSKLFLKFHFPLFNPLLTAVLLVIGFLKVTGMDYKDYNEGASYINYLLTPSTICLAVPLYEQIKLLKKNYKAIFLGILSGVVTGLFAVYVLCLAFGFDHASYVTLLPKSITTAIGMGLSEELGGYVSITVGSSEISSANPSAVSSISPTPSPAASLLARRHTRWVRQKPWSLAPSRVPCPLSPS